MASIYNFRIIGSSSQKLLKHSKRTNNVHLDYIHAFLGRGWGCVASIVNGFDSSYDPVAIFVVEIKPNNTATKEGSNSSLTALIEQPQVSANRSTMDFFTQAEFLLRNPG